MESTLPAFAYGASDADDLRSRGWAVAVHNDYFLHGQLYTFWLVTKRLTATSYQLALKGEGTSDAAALDVIRAQAEGFEGSNLAPGAESRPELETQPR